MPVYDILYLSAEGDKEQINEALSWVDADEKRSLVLLESAPSKRAIRPRVTVVAPPFEESLKSFVWSHLFRPWHFIGDGETEKEVADLILAIELTVGLYRDFGIPQLMNTFANLSAAESVQCGEALFGKFVGTPAIICGAGPSLEKSLDQLRELENRALIFGGGSALVPLSRSGVPIHFAVAIDPESPRERFFQQSHFHPPLFYQNQVSHSLFLQSHGPKLCLGESGSFPLERYLDLPLSQCDVGWTVSTFATQIAYQLGCDPII
nr:hypothetical protein [Chlamydiota bacterium]